MPAGRPLIPITDKMIENARKFAGQGLSRDEIAYCLGLAPSTLFAKMRDNPELMTAIKHGRAEGMETITNALFESAKKGNTTAQVFYLKNRNPETWRDRKEHIVEDNRKSPLDMTREELLREREETLAAEQPTSH